MDLWSAQSRRPSIAEESRESLKQLSRGRGYLVYSRPTATDVVGANFDAPGHITPSLERIGVSQGSDLYLCGPSSFLQNMRDGLPNWDVLAGNVHTEIFGLPRGYPLVWCRLITLLICHKGRLDGPPRLIARSGITASWDPKFTSLLELAEHATFRSDGRAGPESVIPA